MQTDITDEGGWSVLGVYQTEWAGVVVMGKALSVSRLLLGHDQEQRQQRALLPVVVPPYSVSGEILLRLAACSTWTSCSPTPGKSVAARFF